VTFMTTYCPPQLHLANSCSNKGSSGCRNIKKNDKKGYNLKGYSPSFIYLMNLL